MASAELRLTVDQRGVLLPVKVVPGASRTRLAGILDGALKLTVAAAAEKGQANQAVLDLLARHLKLPRKQLSIDRGQTNPHKTVLIEGIRDPEIIRERLKL